MGRERERFSIDWLVFALCTTGFKLQTALARGELLMPRRIQKERSNPKWFIDANGVADTILKVIISCALILSTAASPRSIR